jgi:hypothetical protein
MELFLRRDREFEFNSRQPAIWVKRAEFAEFEYFPPEVSVENTDPLFTDYSESGPEIRGLEQLGAISTETGFQ